jgi:hypothetical protein
MGHVADDMMGLEESRLDVGHGVAFEEQGNLGQTEKSQGAMDVDGVYVEVRSGRTPPPVVPRRPKRARSLGGSVRDPIELASERQLCIGGEMWELIDLTEDEV